MASRLVTAFAAVMVFAAMGSVAGAGPQSAPSSVPFVSGAGGSFSKPAIDLWRARLAHLERVLVNYVETGDKAGLAYFEIDQTDFAATVLVPNRPARYVVAPVIPSGISLMYNLRDVSGRRIRELRLSSEVIAGIFTGTIVRWDDPAIVALNPNLELPDDEIVPVLHGERARSSAILSLYLDATEPAAWQAFVERYGCAAPCWRWPPFPGSTQQLGDDGVANFIANDALGHDSIGLVYTMAARQRSFPSALIRNATGSFQRPTAGAIRAALSHTRIKRGGTLDYTGAFLTVDPRAYPLANVAYIFARTQYQDRSKDLGMGRFLIYAACRGQQDVLALYGTRLPANLVNVVLADVARIDGAPAPPSLADCLHRSHALSPGSP